MAIYTTFNERGDEENCISCPIHIVGKTVNRALEIQVDTNSTVEISLKEILQKFPELVER